MDTPQPPSLKSQKPRYSLKELCVLGCTAAPAMILGNVFSDRWGILGAAFGGGLGGLMGLPVALALYRTICRLRGRSNRDDGGSDVPPRA